LTFNPLSHLDPIGILALFVAGFGWAKPVPVNFLNLRDQRKGVILVSSAGVLANILLAFVAQMLIRLFSGSSLGIAASLVHVCMYVAYINITLAALNLIPIPPLDGSKILMGILWEKTPHFLTRLEPYGFFIIIGFLFLGILDPLIGFFEWVIGTLIGILIP
jgi:Zn-dependent protease